MKLIDFVECAIQEVRRAISVASDVICSAPDGMLRTRRRGNEIQYYSRLKSETAGNYLGRNNTELVKQLEEKYYYTKLLHTAQNEEQTLLHVQKILKEMPDYKSVFLSIPVEKRHLISPYDEKPTANEDEWIRVFVKKNVPSEIKLVTQNGEHVRSKSELIIADRLKASGIAYYYEDPLILHEEKQINCLYWHPDFRVQNKRTGKQYYWEHFGLLDNPNYCKSCQEKIELYAHYGYYPGENLIITSESSNHGLNMEYVDCLIEKYLK